MTSLFSAWTMVKSVIETFGTSERVNYRRIWLLLF